MKYLTVISGDQSSDVYAYEIAQELKKQDIKIYGIAGDATRSIIPTMHDQKILKVIGISEVFKDIWKILKLRRTIINETNKLESHVVLLLDCPSFNMSLLKAFKKHTIIYAIPPQTWAWHASRIQKLKKYCKEVWVIFPFEKDFYLSHGLNVKLLKHPLLKMEHLKPRALYSPNKKRIALLPGSRKSEVSKHMPYLIELTKKRADIEWIWVEAHDNLLDPWQHEINIKVVSLKALPEVSLAIAAAGTVTLELALMQIPMIIFYKVSLLTYLIAKLVVNTPFIGLPNILLQEKVIPELIQYNLTVENIIKEIDSLSTSLQYEKLSKIREDFKKVENNDSLKDAFIKYINSQQS